MIEAAQQGRDLHLTVEGVESPFVIRPLPGRMGKHVTEQYLKISARKLPAQGMEDLLRIAVDGGHWVGDYLAPMPTDGQHIYNRCEDELSTAEAQDILLPALFWQTVLGMDGVETYVKAGGGFAGGVKALGFLLSTLGISPLLTSHSTELETLIRAQANMPSTDTPTDGPTLAKLPAEKRSIHQGKKPRKR
ncbi:hypothetical protein B7R22_17210 [Subtercola boreus]|uniref:Uncharacterized protein n=1 Tax=Subtercola boreus TaxID=120213 RepID=A0A3E0VTE5_9MICO|nr:hypothetical protein [Subtercola boreus]RFA12167.1 hypothetical protein B7R22_17210 [Subtercola boreus]